MVIVTMIKGGPGSEKVEVTMLTERKVGSGPGRKQSSACEILIVSQNRQRPE